MRRAAGFVLFVMFVLGIATPARGAPQRQTSDLTAPLRAANICGAGLPGETYFTLAATGDTFPHENIQAAAEANGYDWLFDQVRPFLKAADLAYTNFDGAMLEGAGYTGYPNFNFNPALATALKSSGIGLVSSANNHILDRGPEGLDATMRVFDQNGIAYHGTVPSTFGDSARPAYLAVPVSHAGITVTLGFVSASWGTNGIPDPYNQVNLLFDTNSYGAQGSVRPGILEAVAQAKRETDLVVVAAHWGIEYQFYPNENQTEAARRLAEAGADIILGAQPHTLQPVDVIDTNGHKTLVIYSLANFLASQGAFQDQFFSATSTIFYVGFVREPDGTVRVTGYRYLPIIHVDNDTRPAPIPPQGYENVIEHVRTIMRDPAGLQQIASDPAALGQYVEICPRYTFPSNPEKAVGGDFATFYRTLGGDTPVSQEEALAVLGVPLGPVRQELSGDCRAATSVLYTPFQRLEWHPEAEWPYRIVGTQLGVEAYRQRYGDAPRGDENAIINPTFRAFFEHYGGRAMFGLPIGGALQEGETNVQYFERARFEAVPNADPNAALTKQVQLGRLSEAYTGIAAQCGIAKATATGNTVVNLPFVGDNQPKPLAVEANSAANRVAPSFPYSLMWVGLIVALAAGIIGGWITFQQATIPHAAARVRARKPQRKVNPELAPTLHPNRETQNANDNSDDDLLRDLLK